MVIIYKKYYKDIKTINNKRLYVLFYKKYWYNFNREVYSMLLYFKIKNFCSFKDEAVFSLKPGKVTERFKDNITVINDKVKVSKLAVIVGENAGGKTSFITGLHFFKTLINGGDVSYRTLKALVYNNDIEKPQSFEISVLVDKIIYTYILEMDSLFITREELYVRNYNQSESSNVYVFKTKRSNVKPEIGTESNNSLKRIDALLNYDLNDKFIPKQIVGLYENSKVSSSSLLINVLYTLDIDIVKPFVDWIRKCLKVAIPKDLALNIYKNMEQDEKDLEIIKTPTFFEIFKLVDSTIVGIEIDDKEPFKDTRIIRRRIDGSEFIIKLVSDSTGVNEFFAWAIQIWKVIHENATLFADEMDKVLNVILSSKIINFVKYNNHQGQFIFSTHNIFHLNTIDYMKEQIFFISKNAETLSSEIYTLADFKDYRYYQPDVYSLYLKGLLGATPND